MDPLHLCVALGPVAVYLLLLALVNLSGRVLVTSGVRDAAALAIALSGLAITGPLKLFVPETAVYRFGIFVWPMLITLYGLGATLAILVMRPRLVLYNITVDQLRPTLAVIVERLDSQARWGGDSLLLPRLGIHLHLEEFVTMRNVQLVSVGARQNLAGWRQLELELARSLVGFQTAPNPRGASLLVVSVALVLVIAVCMVGGQQSVAQGLSELLWLQ